MPCCKLHPFDRCLLAALSWQLSIACGIVLCLVAPLVDSLYMGMATV